MGVTVTESHAKINSPECSPCNGFAQVICHSTWKANSGENSDNTLHWHLTTARGCLTKLSCLVQSVHGVGKPGACRSCGPKRSTQTLWQITHTPTIHHNSVRRPPGLKMPQFQSWRNYVGHGQEKLHSMAGMWSRTPGLSGHWPSAVFCTLYSCTTSRQLTECSIKTWCWCYVPVLWRETSQHNSSVNKLFSFMGRSGTETVI